MAGRDPLSAHQVSLAMSAFGDRPKDGTMYQAIFALGVWTGARISEILSLNRSDILTAAGEIVPRVTYLHTKNGEARTVKLNHCVAPYLRKHLIEQEARGYRRGCNPVFQSCHGRRLSRRWAGEIIGMVLREALGDAARWGTHSMRKTYGKHIYLYYLEQQRSGANVDPLIKTKEAMGHKNLEATSRYLAFMLNSYDDAIDALSYENTSQNYQKPIRLDIEQAKA